MDQTFSPGTTYSIRYMNGSGEVSNRNIRVTRTFWGRNGFQYIKAYCSLRQEERTFRADRIIDVSTDRPGSSHRAAAPRPEPRVVRPAREPVFTGTWKPRPAAESDTSPSSTEAAYTKQPGHSRGFGEGLAFAFFLWVKVGAFLAAGGLFMYILSGGPEETSAVNKKYSLSLQTTQSSPVSRSLPPSGAELRAERFREKTGISCPHLADTYEDADRDGDERLSWDELSDFQRMLDVLFTYRPNETALRPDDFFIQAGGDCEDWALFTAGLLRYWGADAYIASFAPSETGNGHALTLVRVADKPRAGMRYYTFGDDASLSGGLLPAGYYVPIDYEHVGSLSNAVGAGWKIRRVYVPESIYGRLM